ncbi:MAG: sodium:proton antiporter NhaD [Gammaproteobacteria bacterium]|nr:sodium:proton antiporter NhaD [Gammaproteobacteria bacterium]
MRLLTLLVAGLLIPELAMAEDLPTLDLTGSERGIYCVLIFLIAYVFVATEEFTHLSKSKPVILAAGIIWASVAVMANQSGVDSHIIEQRVKHNLEEYAALMLFLLVAISYVNAMTERNVFEALRSWLVRMNFGYRKLFWITGVITFFLSAIADNLTSALLVGAVVMAVGVGNKEFVTLGLLNLVLAANAGGAFSPFGDLTTLMVWQSGKVEFFEFFALFFPSVVNYIVPAFFMIRAVPDEQPVAIDEEEVKLKPGALSVCGLFIATIGLAVSFENFLHLPPFLGMMTGFSLLMIFYYFLRKDIPTRIILPKPNHGEKEDVDIFNAVRDAEWDTLLFFFGVVFAVGGLGYIGYLQLASNAMYGGLGDTGANVLVGLLSAIVDNIPVMFAVLNMGHDMDLYQWLLVTLTAGVGGSLLSIGSAAGVALMGQSKGMYTFFSHIRWTPVIFLGYVASIIAHYLINS